MQKINWLRVVLGGSLAALVLVLLATAAARLIFGSHELQMTMQALRPSAGIAALLFVLFSFLILGILETTSYAMIRPRFGPGPSTAAMAAFGMWLIGVWMSVVGFAITGMAGGRAYPLPSGPLVPCVSLLILVVGAMAGGSVYQEQSANS